MALDLAVRFPSLRWGEREWLAVLRADDGMVTHMLNDMAVIGAQHDRQQQRRRASALTDREIAYLTAVSDGMDLAEVAHFYHVSRDTVKTILLKARQRLGARNTLHAATIAVGEGLIPAPNRPAA